MSEASRLRVGVQLPEVERRVPWLEYLAMARAAEEVGFDSIWLGDHLLYRDDGREERGPWDAWSLLSALAAVTDRVRLGPLVACAGFCPAGLLARRAAAIQEISGGRLVLGLGAGWNETEFRAFGIPFDQRASRFGESFEIIRRLLAGERVTFEGRFERVQDAVLLPLPDVPVPLMVGSTGERVLRAALAHADAWNVWYEWYGNTPEGFATENDRVGRLAREAGTRPRRRPPDGHSLRRPRGRHPRSAPHERRARAHGATRDHRQRAGNLRGGRAARGDPGRQPDHRTLDPNARPNHRRTQHLTWRTQCAVSFNVDDRWTGEDA